jgi:hypothetical protein
VSTLLEVSLKNTNEQYSTWKLLGANTVLNPQVKIKNQV